MKKIFLFLMLTVLTLFLVSSVSATDDHAIRDLGTFKQNTNVNLIQLCGDCTFNNITSVLFPNSTTAVSNVSMTRDGTLYNFTLNRSLTLTNGNYIVNGFGDLGGVDTIWSYTFSITPTGDSDGLLGFFIVVYLILSGIVLFGFYIHNEWIAILGGMGLIFMGVFILNSGIIIFRNDATQVISLVTIGLGTIISIITGLGIIENNL